MPKMPHIGYPQLICTRKLGNSDLLCPNAFYWEIPDAYISDENGVFDLKPLAEKYADLPMEKKKFLAGELVSLCEAMLTEGDKILAN